jgi:hypothetical protein
MSALSLDGIENRAEPCVMCKHKEMCAEQRIACNQFYGYVNNTSGLRGQKFTREPTREIYLMLFPGEREQ